MKIVKPKAPKGYRLLKDGISKNKKNDLIWTIDDYLTGYEWIDVINVLILSGSPLVTGKTYYEPKTGDTWNAFRCRKKRKKK